MAMFYGWGAERASFTLKAYLLGSRSAGRDWHRIAVHLKADGVQSTRPHGARPAPWGLPACPAAFQSTRPHGARPNCSCTNTVKSSFQSTRPHGARPYTTQTWF